MSSLLVELSMIESIGIFVIFGAILFTHFHLPQVSIGGRGISLKGMDTDLPAQHTSKSGCTVCPRCEAGNRSVYTYCGNCVNRL